jgi:hypothetical protein
VGNEEFKRTEDEKVGAIAEGSGKAERVIQYTQIIK